MAHAAIRAASTSPPSSIMDARCLELAREDGVDRRTGVTWPDHTAIALLMTLELPPTITSEQAFEEIGRARESGAPDTPLARLCRALDEAVGIDDVQIAVPGDHARMAQLLALREEVPASVNSRIGRAKQDVDPRIEKTAGDMIVPFDRLEELLACYEREFQRRRLDAAVWGHISDGNLHPNVLPRSFADVEAGRGRDPRSRPRGDSTRRIAARRTRRRAEAASSSSCSKSCTGAKESTRCGP